MPDDCRTSILRRRMHIARLANRSTSVQGFQNFGRRFLDYFWTIVIHFFVIKPVKVVYSAITVTLQASKAMLW